MLKIRIGLVLYTCFNVCMLQIVLFIAGVIHEQLPADPEAYFLFLSRVFYFFPSQGGKSVHYILPVQMAELKTVSL